VPGFPTTPVRLTREYGNAFMLAETEDPDVERMLHAFKHPGMALALVAFLPRYFSPRLVKPTRTLAHSSDPVIQAGAISGLISLLDAAPETRAFVLGLLHASNPAVRGRAAEYLCWFGSAEDAPVLTKSAAAESDVHARAAMVAAAAAIQHRASLFGDGAAATLTPGANPAETYQNLAELLAAHSTAATRLAVIERLRNTEAFEPITRFSDRMDHGERGGALLGTHRLLVGYPETADAPEPPAAAAPATFPVARTLIGPVRDYFDDRRRSYGTLVPPGGPYGGKYHVGDDVAWKMDHETVVAIGPGIVRSADLGRRGWGGLVVIEHVDAAGGRFCSLYGHLGPLVCVHAGQIVRQGDKLGAVGVTYSHANGGYMAHMHFGIHRGAFLLPDRVGAVVPLSEVPGETLAATVTAVHDDSVDLRLADGTTRSIERSEDWTCGYLTPAEFASKTHGWVEPMGFIRGFK